MPGVAGHIKGYAHRVRRRILPLLYRGNRYECIACGASVRRFMAGGARFAVLREKQVVGAGYRKNNYCPSCGATDRERLALAFIAANPVLVHDGAVILHVAPEPSLCRYFGSREDIVHIRADYLRPSVSVALDLQLLPFRDAQFDLVICNHVLEHVCDDAKAMMEIRRVMKPDARAILQAPIALTEPSTIEDPSVTDPAERERQFGQDDHVRLYGRDYCDRLTAAGLIADGVSWIEQPELFGGAPGRLGLNPDELLFVARRAYSELQ